jgi:hypothetical protein
LEIFEITNDFQFQGTPLFDISISEPEKHGEGMSAYVTYTIKTKVLLENVFQK